MKIQTYPESVGHRKCHVPHGIQQRYKKTNGSEHPDINPHIYSQPIFDKRAQKQDGEKTASSTNAVGKTRYLYAED
jgi:hypothetical protein